MWLASVRTIPGIHHCNPATPPMLLRIVKVSLSFSTRSAVSCVVVVQTFPTIGNRTLTTGPVDRSFSISAAGLRRYAWLAKSARIIDPCTSDGFVCYAHYLRPKWNGQTFNHSLTNFTARLFKELATPSSLDNTGVSMRSIAFLSHKGGVG